MAKYEEYQGQLFDAVKSRKEGGSLVSTRFNVLDKLSPVVEKNDVPFITTFAPYSVYVATILEGKESVEANITLEDFYDLKSKTVTANDVIFRTQIGLRDVPIVETETQAETGEEGEVSEAFTVRLSMGEFKGKTPGDVILGSADKAAAIEALKKHAEFCGRNLEKYPGNQKFIDAIRAAIDLFDLDLLESEKKLAQKTGKTAQAKGFFEFNLHDPIDKYYAKKVQRIEGEEFFKCYRYKISVRPGNNYPYHLEITNFWAPIGHTQSGLTPIQTAKAKGEIRKSFDLTMPQWTNLMERMYLNTESCHNLFYPDMRRKDDSYSYRNQAS